MTWRCATLAIHCDSRTRAAVSDDSAPSADVRTPCRVCVGVQGFSPPDRVGTFYPPGSPTRSFLSFYARVFDAVELNTTFYATPSVTTVKNWATRVPPHFVFAAKMPRSITHDRRLKGCEPALSEFLDRMRILGIRLGAILIQFPASFTRLLEERLSSFLGLLPPDLRFAVEFRHQSWQHDDVFDLLREFSVAWCVTQWQSLPVVVQVTTDFAYIRLVGIHSQIAQVGQVQLDRSRELAALADTIKQFERNLKRVYVFVNNHYAGHAPATVAQLKELLSLPVVDPHSLWPEQPMMLPGMSLPESM